MGRANYGVSLNDMGISEEIVKFLIKDLGPLEKSAIINYLLDNLLKQDCKCIDGDNPADNYLTTLSYDQDSDNVYFWTENL